MSSMNEDTIDRLISIDTQKLLHYPFPKKHLCPKISFFQKNNPPQVPTTPAFHKNHPGSNNIRSHEALKGFDFAKYKSQTMVSPFIPPVKSEDDMSNFSCSEEDLPPEKPYVDPGTHWEDDF
jgi:hypothetical protein